MGQKNHGIKQHVGYSTIIMDAFQQASIPTAKKNRNIAVKKSFSISWSMHFTKKSLTVILVLLILSIRSSGVSCFLSTDCCFPFLSDLRSALSGVNLGIILCLISELDSSPWSILFIEICELRLKRNKIFYNRTRNFLF